MGELLPGWRQQDLLGAAGPGLLRKDNTERGDGHKGGERTREGDWKRRHKQNCEKIGNISICYL